MVVKIPTQDEEIFLLLFFSPILMTYPIFLTPFRALVIGSTGAIGEAFVKAFKADSQCEHVEELSRSQNPGFDLNHPQDFEGCLEKARAAGPYQIIVDATGALTIDNIGPEKALRQLEADRLTRSFQVNAIGPAVMLKCLAPLIAPGRVFYAKLSARVGSIADNWRGGWYGYRASKAALNMLLHTAAIELQRRNPQLRVVALQPGTVESNLSKPFLAAAGQILTPQESVSGLLSALAKIEPRQGAHFIDYQGHEIAW